jgi:hypothetical protein
MLPKKKDRGVGLGPAARVGRLLADGRVLLAVAACQRAAPAHTRTSVVSALATGVGSNLKSTVGAQWPAAPGAAGGPRGRGVQCRTREAARDMS